MPAVREPPLTAFCRCRPARPSTRMRDRRAPDDRPVVVRAPHQPRRDRRAVDQRDRDHARMRQPVRHPSRDGGDRAARNDEREPLLGIRHVLAAELRRPAARRVQRPERPPLGVQVRPARERLIEDVRDAQLAPSSERVTDRHRHEHRGFVQGHGAQPRGQRRRGEQPDIGPVEQHARARREPERRPLQPRRRLLQAQHVKQQTEAADWKAALKRDAQSHHRCPTWHGSSEDGATAPVS
jgi:hypothetical protein